MKSCNKFIHITDQLNPSTMLIKILELHYVERDKIVFDSFRTLYQLFD